MTGSFANRLGEKKIGAGLIIAVRLSAEEGSRLEAPTMALGALLIACAHIANHRLCRSCAACHPAGE